MIAEVQAEDIINRTRAMKQVANNARQQVHKHGVLPRNPDGGSPGKHLTAQIYKAANTPSSIATEGAGDVVHHVAAITELMLKNPAAVRSACCPSLHSDNQFTVTCCATDILCPTALREYHTNSLPTLSQVPSITYPLPLPTTGNTA